MVAHHHQPATGAQHVGRLQQHFLQGLHFLVHLDAQGLKNLGQILVFLAARRAGRNGLFELGNGSEATAAPGRAHGGGQRAGIGHLAVHAENAVQVGFLIIVEDIGGRERAVGVHSHIERAIETG